MKQLNYGEAIREGFDYLLTENSNVFVLGQGLWSPWYVGNSMTDLDKKFGKDRIIDTPVSESACTGAAVGAGLAGARPIVVHPRLDFMLYAMDAIVNQAAKWSHMTGGQASPAVTIRGIINRGGEQGAQHSQALHAWFAHTPGLAVVMPHSVSDARDLLIASAMYDGPVVYIDDRWLYDQVDEVKEPQVQDLAAVRPKVLRKGSDITIVGCGYGVMLAMQAADLLDGEGINAEIIDLRLIAPLRVEEIVASVKRTQRFVVVDPGTKTSGFASEVITSVLERLQVGDLLSMPVRATLPDAPAPTSKRLEGRYYPAGSDVASIVMELFKSA